MIIDAVSFDFGASPSTGFQLVSSEGLAPLLMPDSIMRFQTAMEDGYVASGDVSRRDIGPQRVAVEEKSAATEMEVKAGFTGLREVELREVEVGLREAGLREAGLERPVVATGKIKVELPDAERPAAKQTVRVDEHIQNPVNLVNPVKDSDIKDSDNAAVPLRVAASPHEETRAETMDVNISRKGVEAQRVVVAEKPVVAEREVRIDFAGLRESGTDLNNVRTDIHLSNPTSSLQHPKPVEGTDASSTSSFQHPKPVEVTDASSNSVLPLSKPVKETGDAEVLIQHPERPAPSAKIPNAEKLGELDVGQKESFAADSLVNHAEKTAGTKYEPVAALRETAALREAHDIQETPEPLPAAPAPQVAAPVEAMPAPQLAAQTARTETIAEAVGKTVEIVNQVVEAVVAEIAVTQTLAQGEGEIRITLKPTVLDGSEIRLTASAGELTVSIAPATAQSAQIVQQHIPHLESALAEHVSSFHHVAVVVSNTKKGKIDEAA